MVARLLIVVVRLYQRIASPVLRLLWGNVCRFEPSCSHYAVACIEAHGALRGSFLSLARLCKCHPFHPGGYDPPPPRPAPRLGRVSQEPLALAPAASGERAAR
jgi:putative membrane protein insertion efficiency factor